MMQFMDQTKFKQRMVCWSSKGGEALGPEKAGCPRIGECQYRVEGLDGLVSREREDGIGYFWRGCRERG